MKLAFARELVALRYKMAELQRTETDIDHLLEGFLETFATNSPIGIYIVKDERIEFVNRQFQKISGYSENELIGMKDLDFVLPKDRDSIMENRIKIQREKRHYAYEYRLVNKAGDTQWVIETFTPIWYSTSQKALGYFVEINEDRQTQQALQESQEFSSSLLVNSPNPIIVINPDTSIRYINPALEELTGFRYSGLVDYKAPYPWCTKETRYKTTREFREAIFEREMRFEDTYQKQSGEHFCVEINSALVRTERELKYCVLYWVDITEHKRLKEDLHHYISEITRAQEEERKRIARELHDATAQALAMTCGECDRILVMNTEMPRKVTRQLKQLRLRIQNILEEVRRYSHELRPGLLDEFGLMPSLELLIEEVNGGGKLDCRMEILTSERRVSPEAELALFRITQEALRNISKHSKATEATVSVEYSEEKISLDVRDNGCGFKVPEVLSSLTRYGKLGIMGMMERARLLNGSFSVESRVGKGTIIRVKIPL